MVWSNCLFWAVRQWAREGGYLLIRKSHYGPFPHFLWSADLKQFSSFVPLDPRHKLIPPPIFRGEVKKEEPDGDLR
jgi:hypothetical protein